jgi:hypothetical protein
VTTYIVILQTSTRHDEFAAYLKTMHKWGRLTDDSWAVVTDKTATQIRDGLTALKAPGDRIAVIKSGYVAAWSNLRANKDWLMGNL